LDSLLGSSTSPLWEREKIERIPLYRALFLPAERDAFIVFRDQVTRLQYLRPINEILDRGLYFKLRGYEYHAYLDFHVVHSTAAQDYRSLYNFIGSEGIPDVDQALRELILKPIQEPYCALVNPGYMGYLSRKYTDGKKIEPLDENEIKLKIGNFLTGISHHLNKSIPGKDLGDEIYRLFTTSLRLKSLITYLSGPKSDKMRELTKFLIEPLDENEKIHQTLMVWALCSQIGKFSDEDAFEDISNAWMDEWQLAKPLSEILKAQGCGDDEVKEQRLLLRLGIAQQDWYEKSRRQPFDVLVKNWLTDPEIQTFLRVNRYQGVLWYNREAFDKFTWWISLIPLIKALSQPSAGRTKIVEMMLNLYEIIAGLKKIERKSDYKFEKLFELIRSK